MNAPVRHPLDGRGHRLPATLAAIERRNGLLCEAADRFCVGLSGRAAASWLHTRLGRYQAGAWRRDRSEALCPARHAGRIEESLWMILKARDVVPSERSIRAVLRNG
jgi:hypothetical protein